LLLVILSIKISLDLFNENKNFIKYIFISHNILLINLYLFKNNNIIIPLRIYIHFAIFTWTNDTNI